MTGRRCTEHPEHHRRNGRCQICRHEARKRHAAKCREQLRRYRELEALMAS